MQLAVKTFFAQPPPQETGSERQPQFRLDTARGLFRPLLFDFDDSERGKAIDCPPANRSRTMPGSSEGVVNFPFESAELSQPAARLRFLCQSRRLFAEAEMTLFFFPLSEIITASRPRHRMPAGRKMQHSNRYTIIAPNLIHSRCQK